MCSWRVGEYQGPGAEWGGFEAWDAFCREDDVVLETPKPRSASYSSRLSVALTARNLSSVRESARPMMGSTLTRSARRRKTRSSAGNIFKLPGLLSVSTSESPSSSVRGGVSSGLCADTVILESVCGGKKRCQEVD